MTEEFHSILLEDFPIEWPGFAVHRVALNQHMPRVEKFSEHQHEVNQALLYLRGYGTQHLAGRSISVQRGSLIVIPSGMRHRFEKSGQRRPVCLAIDFESVEVEHWKNEAAMPAADLKEIEAWLVALNEEESNPEKSSVRIASLILSILDTLQRTANDLVTQPTGPVTASVWRVIARLGLVGLTPRKVAQSLARSLDHLNRQLRSECGITLGESISRARLQRTCELLKESDLPLGEIAADVGIDDQNYFSRWFRRKTGQTPSGWRAAMR